MGIVRSSSSRLLAPFEASYTAVYQAIQAAGLEVTHPGNPIGADAKRSVRKNRWAASVSAGVRPESETTSLVEWSIDMLGDKHREVLSEIVAALTVPVDDLGLGQAVGKLGKFGQWAGAREIAVLSQHLRLDERVVEAGQGSYGGNMGVVVLTTRRLVFLDRAGIGFGSRMEEFDLAAITSVGLRQQRTGEVLDISISGRAAEISHLQHGRGEAIAAALRYAKANQTGSAQLAAAPPAVDVADQIRKLAELRDQGILTDLEFQAKKAELLSRM